MTPVKAESFSSLANTSGRLECTQLAGCIPPQREAHNHFMEQQDAEIRPPFQAAHCSLAPLKILHPSEDSSSNGTQLVFAATTAALPAYAGPASPPPPSSSPPPSPFLRARSALHSPFAGVQAPADPSSLRPALCSPGAAQHHGLLRTWHSSCLPAAFGTQQEDTLSLSQVAAFQHCSLPRGASASLPVMVSPEGGRSKGGRAMSTVPRKSKFRGVQWEKSCSKWRARIHTDKTRHIGYFEDEEEAALAWDLAALRHFGTSWEAKLNFAGTSLALFEQEQAGEGEGGPRPGSVETLVSKVTPRSYRGVQQVDHGYKAVVLKNRASIEIGVYGTAEEAARAFDLESLRLNGRGSITNFPLSDYTKELEQWDQAYLKVTKDPALPPPHTSAHQLRVKGRPLFNPSSTPAPKHHGTPDHGQESLPPTAALQRANRLHGVGAVAPKGGVLPEEGTESMAAGSWWGSGDDLEPSPLGAAVRRSTLQMRLESSGSALGSKRKAEETSLLEPPRLRRLHSTAEGVHLEEGRSQGVVAEGDGWRASLTVDLGRFPSQAEAARAHDRASLLARGFSGPLASSLGEVVQDTVAAASTLAQPSVKRSFVGVRKEGDAYVAVLRIGSLRYTLGPYAAAADAAHAYDRYSLLLHGASAAQGDCQLNFPPWSYLASEEEVMGLMAAVKTAEGVRGGRDPPHRGSRDLGRHVKGVPGGPGSALSGDADVAGGVQGGPSWGHSSRGGPRSSVAPLPQGAGQAQAHVPPTPQQQLVLQLLRVSSGAAAHEMDAALHAQRVRTQSLPIPIASAPMQPLGGAHSGRDGKLPASIPGASCQLSASQQGAAWAGGHITLPLAPRGEVEAGGKPAPPRESPLKPPPPVAGCALGDLHGGGAGGLGAQGLRGEEGMSSPFMDPLFPLDWLCTPKHAACMDEEGKTGVGMDGHDCQPLSSPLSWDALDPLSTGRVGGVGPAGMGMGMGMDTPGSVFMDPLRGMEKGGGGGEEYLEDMCPVGGWGSLAAST